MEMPPRHEIKPHHIQIPGQQRTDSGPNSGAGPSRSSSTSFTFKMGPAPLQWSGTLNFGRHASCYFKVLDLRHRECPGFQGLWWRGQRSWWEWEQPAFRGFETAALP